MRIDECAAGWFQYGLCQPLRRRLHVTLGLQRLVPYSVTRLQQLTGGERLCQWLRGGLLGAMILRHLRVHLAERTGHPINRQIPIIVAR